jgi:DNA-binding transcriptional MerR regulator
MTETPIRIGALARRAGVSADTIRHYERLGLLRKAPRSTGGYRMFPPSTLDRVTLIRDGVRVGFSLRQLSIFLRARQDGRPPCRQVRAAGAQILEGLDQQIATLVSTRHAVQAMLDDWDERLARTPSSEPARLLDALGSGAERASRSTRSNLKSPR